MKKRFTTVMVLFGLISGTSLAVESIIITADRMLDVVDGKMISPAVIVVEGDTITAVNPRSVPGGGEQIDLGDMTLLPGLIDVHYHFNAPYETVPLDMFQRTVPYSTLTAMNQARTKLLQGFTTIRMVGAFDYIDVALARAGDEGLVDVPRIFAGGHMISMTGGHADVTTGYSPDHESNYRDGIADGVPELLKAVRYQIKHGATWIKVMATAGVASQSTLIGAQQYSFEELRAIVGEAARAGINVAAHAHYEPGLGDAVRAGVASIEHGSLASMESLAEMKQRGTFMVMTANGINMWKASGKYDELPEYMQRKFDYVEAGLYETMQSVVDMGVKVAFGTDVAAQYGNREFALYVDQFGMLPLRAIRTATTDAAELLEVTDRAKLEVGLLADVVAVPGNPLDNIKALEDVRFVMKGGQVYKQP